MIMDAQLLPSDAQAVTTTAPSVNAIDLGVARDIGRGAPLRAVAVVTAGFAGGTSIRADLVESDNADLSSPATLVTGNATTTANAVAGRKLADVIVPTTSKRYLGFNYVVSGTMSAGKVTAGLVLDTDANLYHTAHTGF